MPSEHLLYYFNEHLKIEKSWTVSGEHYKKTSYGWLDNMDANKDEILQLFKNVMAKVKKENGLAIGGSSSYHVRSYGGLKMVTSGM